MLIALNATRENGQFIGDQLCMLKVAYLFAQNAPAGTDHFILSCSPGNEMHSYWQRFIDTYKVEVVYDTWNPGNMEQRFENWDKWRSERAIEGRKFDHYRELYRRIDGAQRQNVLCGGENGLRRKNIFEYMYYGQENFPLNCADVHIIGGDSFDDTLIYHPTYPADREVLLAPHAKCQGNHVFTFDYWNRVVRKLIDAGISVTVNYDGNFCNEFNGHPLFQKIYPSPKELVNEVCRHKIVTCGNTGIGWMAAACGVPLLAMQPPNSNMADYRYELCGLKSLVEIMDTPDADYCARRLIEEVNRVTVFTTGCYDVIHAGHIRHLEESRGLGTRLIVALNSDDSVRKLKGDGRPVNNEQQRAMVLKAIRWVDEVRIFDGPNAMELIREIKPDVITNGCDHNLHEIVGKDYVEQYGGRAVVTSGTREQSSTNIIHHVIKQHDILKAVNDAVGVAINPQEKLRLLAKEFVSVASLVGDAVDLGAYKGGCSLVLRRLAPNKHLHVIDTWQGNPFDDPLCHHRKGEWAASLADCQALVGKNERTHYWEGVFPYSAEELKGRMFAFVYVDPDTYTTVKDAIDFFWPRMLPGGKMMFDDYGWEACSGVKKAVDEAFGDSERVVYPQNYACVVVKR